MRARSVVKRPHPNVDTIERQMKRARRPSFRAIVSLCAIGATTLMVPGRALAAASVTSVALTKSLTGSSTITFSGSVVNVRGDNVVLRVQDTTTNLSATLACRGSTGTAVPCLTGPVRSVVITQRAPLIAGQRYSVIVNPVDASSPVIDATQATAIPTNSHNLIASLYEQENSAGAAYYWRNFVTSSAYGGSYQGDYLPDASFTFRFTGTSVTWYTVTGTGQGKAAVSIDGHRYSDVNNYASSAHYRVARAYSGLANAYHYMTVRVLGTKGSTNGTGTWIGVDGFAVNGAFVSAPNLSFRWETLDSTAASGGHYVRAGTPGEKVTFVFRGRSIDWITITGPTQGTSTMYVDGVKKASVDNHASTYRYGVVRRISNLSDAVHTLSIVSGSARTSVDRFIVRLPDVTIFRRLGTWVDLFDYGTSSGLNAATASAAMKSHGVKTIYIETARYNSTSAFNFPADVDQWIEAAHANGMKIVGWYFPGYASYLDIDVDRTVAIATHRTSSGQGFDGLAIDIEHRPSSESLAEWVADIATHLGRVRYRATAAFPIGAIVPAPLAMDIYPNSWTGFPWAYIGSHANAVLPMGYWSYRTDCSTDPSHCAYGYSYGNVVEARSKTGLLVHLIGGIGDSVTTSEVADFIRGAKDAKAYGASLYDYRTTSSSFWSPLAGANSL
jgi:hypothetical protein